MEQVINRVEEALGIIEKVKEVANGIRINNHQCRRLANHFEIVGNSLCYCREVCKSTLTNDEENFPFPTAAFNDLLVVLKRGEALVLQYNEQHWLTRLLIRADNHERFEDIHRELEKCKLFLLSGEFDHSTDNNVNFGIMSVEQENDILFSDTHQDQAEMLGMLESLYNSPPLDHTRKDLQNVRNVLYETFQGHEGNECEDLDQLPSHFKVNRSNYSIERRIAEGAEVVVEKSKWLGCDVAIKRRKKFDSLTQMYNEVGFMKRLRHSQIVQVVGVSLPTNSSRGLWSDDITMELMDGDFHTFIERRRELWSGDIIMELMDGDLCSLIHRHMEEKKGKGVPFNQSVAIDIIIQIARAIQHLHMKGCMHGDIKSGNILFNDHSSYVDVKITDFGLSSQVVKEDVYTNKHTFPSINFGTSLWRAPELWEFVLHGFSTYGYSAKVDIFSFGMTCYEILTGNKPWNGMSISKLHRHVMVGHRPMLPLNIGGKLSDVIQDCWNLDPTRRPTTTEICARLDEIKCLDTHDGGFMHFAIAKKFLNLIRPTVHRMKRFFHLFGRQGFEDIETSEVEVVPQLDGAESSRSTPNIQGLPRYLCMDPSTFQDFWWIHGDKEDRVQVVGTKVGGCKYVIKIFKNIEGQEQDPSFRIELDFLVRLHHPHIVQLMGYFLDCLRTSIVLEWVPSDLRKLINDRMKTKNSIRPFSKEEAKSLITQIAAGMAFLHARDVFHRDLKARNVLVHEHPNRLHAKITDFGASRDFYVASPVESVGTSYWRAPEIFRAMQDNRQFEYTAKADVYSFAMVCYEILSGKEPFEDHQRSHFDFLIDSSAVHERPSLPGNQNHPLNKLIKTCWDDVPEQRPTFRDILSKLEAMV
jgi:serine/threonine protein kinase